MKRVLFVDDEPVVLDTLRRLLRRRRGHWDMVFEAGPEQALARLSVETFDVIVSDLHMPHMSGIELLQRASASHPRMVRIVLSGTADLREAEAIADRVLAKPCDAQHLCSAIDESLVAKEAV